MSTTAPRLEASSHEKLTRLPTGGTAPGDREAPRRGALPPRERTTPSPLPRNLLGLRVLVVDDDESTLEFLAAALGHCGADVVAAASAPEALAALGQARPHVVLSDIAMRGNDGYWLLREIRALPDPALSAVPVVAATAYGRSHPAERTRTAGFAAHLAKPVDPEVLCRAIAAAAGR